MSGGELRGRLETFVARCRAVGVAVTPQRLAIFRRLASTDAHPSAEELHAAVLRELPTLSLAGVRRPPRPGVTGSPWLVTRSRSSDGAPPAAAARRGANQPQHKERQGHG